jgi:acetylornithine aminotransferase
MTTRQLRLLLSSKKQWNAMQLFDVYPLFDINLVRGQGCYLWDDAGNRYLDLYGGHAVISIGHSHPRYVARVREQVGALGFYSNSVQIPLQQQLANALGRLSGCDEYQLFLCNSGAEANENALKLASFHTGKPRVLAFRKGFHGRTSAAVAATDSPAIVAPVNRGHRVTILDFDDADSLEHELRQGDVCAVILEAIQGVGGVRMPSTAFLKELRELCTQYGALLVMDEVQAGYGRTGKFFAFQHAGIEPDLISMAKGMGNGFPIGGILIHPSIRPKHGMLGTTFGGNHLACAAGLAVLETIEEEGLMENARNMGAYLREALADLPLVQEIRGRGLMVGLAFEGSIAPLRQWLLQEARIFTGSSSPNVLRILPPLNITQAELDYFVEQLAVGLEAQAVAK